LRIGILGGTFDPPHRGHLYLARAALDAVPLDQVWFLPAGCHPFKSSRQISGVAHRLAMVERAIADEPGFFLCRHEADSPSVAYTVDTLAALGAQYPGHEWCFLFGADIIGELHLWKEWQRLLELAHLCILERVGYPLPAAGSTASSPAMDWLLAHRCPVLSRGGSHGVLFVPVTPPAISSSLLRQRLEAGDAVDGWLTAGVTGYIAQQGLYRPKETAR
jgi:nicotinate-nucleotide adenylyltransferase